MPLLSDVFLVTTSWNKDRGEKQLGSYSMPKRREAEKFAAAGKKDCWHSYGLQGLTPNRFASVVTKILKGHYILVNPRLHDRASI
jgi:hypothetical protein